MRIKPIWHRKSSEMPHQLILTRLTVVIYINVKTNIGWTRSPGVFGSPEARTKTPESEVQKEATGIAVSLNLYETVGFETWELPRWGNWPPYMRKGKSKRKRQITKGLICRRFNKQGNLHTSLVLGSCMTNRSPPLLVRILRVYPETLIGFSHIHPDRFNNTLFSQGCGLAPTVGTVCGIYSSSQ